MSFHDHAPGEYEWDLDGYVFGCGHPVEVADFRPGTLSWRAQREPVPSGHGVLAGRDWLAGRTWGFDLTVVPAGIQGLAALDELLAAWAAASRRGPGQVSALSYGLPGRRRVVYGRPGEITPADTHRLLHFGHAGVVADFTLTDPLVYEEAERSLELTLAQAPGGGATWPVVWPVTWDRATSARQGVVHVGGDAPVPFTVTIFGPASGVASGFSLSGPGWAIDVDVAVGEADELVIDTRQATVLRNGVSVAGGLSRRSRLTARLAQGDSEVVFSALDPTNTARAVISWRPGYYSI